MRYLVIIEGKETEIEADTFQVEYDGTNTVIFSNIKKDGEFNVHSHIALLRNVDKIVPIGQ